MTPRSGLGQLITLIGYSSELLGIAEARRFTTVVIYRRLQTNNPHYHPLFSCTALRASTLTVPWLGRSVTNQRVKTATEVSHAGLEPLYLGTNRACFSLIIIQTFSSIYTQVQTDQFSKIITIPEAWIMYHALFKRYHPNVLYTWICCSRNILSVYIQTTSGSVCENDHRVQVWNPISNYFRNFNTTVHVI